MMSFANDRERKEWLEKILLDLTRDEIADAKLIAAANNMQLVPIDNSKSPTK